MYHYVNAYFQVTKKVKAWAKPSLLLLCACGKGKRGRQDSKTQHFLVLRGRERGGGMRLGVLAAWDSKLRRRLLGLLINSVAGRRQPGNAPRTAFVSHGLTRGVFPCTPKPLRTFSWIQGFSRAETPLSCRGDVYPTCPRQSQDSKSQKLL